MSRVRMLLVAVLLAGFAAFAQDSAPTPPATTATPPATTSPRHNHMHGDRAEQRLKRMAKRLSLTDDQKEKVRPILQDEEKQLTNLESDGNLTPQQKRKKEREIRVSSRSQIDAILTPEQKEKLPSGRGGYGRRHPRRSGQANSPNTDPGTPQ